MPMYYDDPILQKCRALLQGLYGVRLHGVVLYGSCARGTAETDSDIDLMVLSKGPVNAAADRGVEPGMGEPAQS